MAARATDLKLFLSTTSLVKVIAAAWGRVKLRILCHACFQKLLKLPESRNDDDTQVILILNFTRIHCDYLLITWRAKLLNFWILKTATIVSQGHPSRTFLSLLRLFHHSLFFLFLFSFSLLSFNSSIYSLSINSKRDTIVKEKLLDWISCCQATWGPIVRE